MVKRALILAVLAGVAAVPLSGQADPRERARTVLPPAVFQNVDALAADVGREGIPPEPLFNKALEGMAKHVPPDLLMRAVRGYGDRLVQTHRAFGAESNTPLLMAGADALQRGVPLDALQDLGRRGMRSPMGVLVLADLIETGVPSSRALDVLHEAMGQHMRDQMMLEIPEQVRRFMREGHSPEAAAERVWRGMRGGMGGMGGGMAGLGGWMGPGVPPGWDPMHTRSGHGRNPGGGM